ncbi:dihydrolipoamide acetyltransferase family protein [Catenulispora subtropica]|uniref:Dihydrolipoamide acetyltransferase component of pyruvate dehydrogenase complex n=1 Tax=Catenulispora subtropica TaxID=450798 RepID=A0ABN2TED9_9ACTN
MGEFRMPSLGADMTEGALVEWLVQPGDTVVKGQAVAVVDTAKSAIEVECFADGVVEELLVEPGTTVPVGTVLAVLGEAHEAGPAPTKAAPAKAAAAKPTAKKPAAKKPATKKSVTRKPAAGKRPATQKKPAAQPADRHPPEAGPSTSRVSPLVRRLARERGVDLGAVHGSGPGGRVTRADIDVAARPAGRARTTPYARRIATELGVDLDGVVGTGPEGAIRAGDVRTAAAAGTAAPTRTATPPVTVSPDRTAARRHAIADLMSRSKHEIPHYYLATTIDLAAAVTWMREHNRGVPVAERLVPSALLLKAAAVAAKQVPEMNGFWIDDGQVRSEHVHLGVAVALREGGLVAPALHDADRLPLPDLMAGLRDLVRRARAGRLRSSETADPTITVTDLGDQGVEAVFGVIYPPQVALVGFGKVTDRPAAVDGLLGVRPCVTATLSADHRAGDGAVGARYLALVDRLLQSPEEL